jgi:hypothetical protein
MRRPLLLALVALAVAGCLPVTSGGQAGVGEDGGEALVADGAGADGAVAVAAGADRVAGVVGVDEDDPVAEGGEQLVEGLGGAGRVAEVVAGGLGVAGVHADLEAEVVVAGGQQLGHVPVGQHHQVPGVVGEGVEQHEADLPAGQQVVGLVLVLAGGREVAEDAALMVPAVAAADVLDPPGRPQALGLGHGGASSGTGSEPTGR